VLFQIKHVTRVFSSLMTFSRTEVQVAYYHQVLISQGSL
jgi:hypothetical protein